MFLPIVFVLYFLIDRFIPCFRNLFLCIASLLFYAFGEPRFVCILIVSILVNWGIALGIDKNSKMFIRKMLLAFGITLNLGLLITYKYLNFVTYNINKLVPKVEVTSIALPIGISFFTFQAMSYVIDVYRGEEAQLNPVNIGLYISLFPQLIAGPIVRYKSISNEIRDRKTDSDDITDGICCFLRGLCKKIIVANNLALVADFTFSINENRLSILLAWLGALAYTLQIYFDFSGYSDMAVGLGRIFGFHFSKNFDYPYMAKSVTDFWRRWHISLSEWFRDYVYIPLGGNKGGWKAQFRNLLVVWLLTGIWHGANWTFIVWGLVYFLMLVIEKFIIHPENFKHQYVIISYRIGVFVAVLFCWVLFRSDSIEQSYRYIKSMFGLYGNPLIDLHLFWYSREYMVFLIMGLLLSTYIIRRLINTIRRVVGNLMYEILRGVGYVVSFVICVSYLVTGAHNPFIYFNF